MGVLLLRVIAAAVEAVGATGHQNLLARWQAPKEGLATGLFVVRDMATIEAEAYAAPSEALPDASEGRLIGQFGLDKREAARIAKQVVEDHRKGKRNAYHRMLTAQKYAYHIDGEGDAQWADIVGGRQVKIPRRRRGALRHQDNILRPMVDYWVGHFTAQTFRAVAEHRADRKSRDQARINTLTANHHLLTQRINDRTAEAMYMAAFNGWGITHSMWRNDITQTGNETNAPYSRDIVHPGFTDVFPGNPFDTVFAPSATRASIPWYSYGRTLRTSLVRQAFPEVPGIEDIEGSDKEPSTSWFQRMLRQWELMTGGEFQAHGMAALSGTEGVEDNIGLICKEYMPGQLSEFPGGLLMIVGLKGASDSGSEEGPAGEPVLLHMGPLPGSVGSATFFYGLSRGDDVHGKAYVADVDDDQVRLNQAITMYAEMMSQFAYPQLFVPQGTQLMANQTIGDKIIEYISQPGAPPPQYQFPGTGANFASILQYIQDIRTAAFRKGGWQASSRGEASGANEPAARARFLAAQDKLIFATTANNFRSSVVDLLRKNHALRLQYQNLPMLVETVGEDLEYLASEYIHRQDLSPSPPNFLLTSGFGASVEERLEQLNALVTIRGGDGEPVLPTKRYWRLHPDPALRPNEPDADDSRRRKAHAINVAIENAVEEFQQQPPEALPPAAAQDPVSFIAQGIYQQFPPTWTDGNALPLFIEALDSLVQDPVVDPLVRGVAEERQKYLLQWQQKAAAAAQPAPAEAAATNGTQPAVAP